MQGVRDSRSSPHCSTPLHSAQNASPPALKHPEPNTVKHPERNAVKSKDAARANNHVARFSVSRRFRSCFTIS